MLTLTRKTEYALLAVCYLARAGRTAVVSAKSIHDEHTIPLPLLMNVLKKLNRAGFVKSVRGAKGGYTLAVSPAELTLSTLIEAVEGPVHLVRCANTDKNGRRCDYTSICPLRRALHKVHHRLCNFLAEVTIAELAFNGWHTPTEAIKVLAE